MRPILFTWRGVPVWSFPTLAYVGITLGIVTQNRAANAVGLETWAVWLATLVTLPAALAGGRVLYVVSHPRRYFREPGRIFRRSEGGMAVYGGVPAMLLASIPILAWLGVPFWSFWDASAFCILVGVLFTRLGCLLHGCCAGRLSHGPLALPVHDGRGAQGRRLPVQAFEIGWAVLLLVAAVVIWPSLPVPGSLFLAALGGYAVGRLLLQPLRASRQRVGRVDVPMAISATLILFSCVAWMVLQP
jgi:phosphatidylglycerol:prolipoprotein diacylglycerol transferase